MSAESGRSVVGRDDAAAAVVIPCHKQGAFVLEAVRSALAQTVENIEVIVVADGDEEVWDTLEGERDDRIFIADTESSAIPPAETPLGVAVARNTGITFTVAPYICCLDGDDVLEPTYLEKLLGAIDTRVEFAIATTHYRAFGDSDERWRSSWHESMVHLSNSLHCASMFTKALWEAAGGYDPAGMGWEDWSFWIACSRLHPKVSVVPEELFRHRVHAAQMSTWIRRNIAAVAASVKLSHPDLYEPGALRLAEKDLRSARREFWQEVVRRQVLFPKNENLRRIAAFAGIGCSLCGRDHGQCSQCGLPLGSIQHAPMPCRCGAWPPALSEKGA